MILEKKIYVFVSIILIIVFTILIYSGPSKDLLKNNILKQEFEGEIKYMYIDTLDHYANKILMRKQKQTIDWKFASLVKVGDSVVKKRNELTVKVYSSNGEKFEYDLLNKKEKR